LLISKAVRSNGSVENGPVDLLAEWIAAAAVIVNRVANLHLVQAASSHLARFPAWLCSGPPLEPPSPSRCPSDLPLTGHCGSSLELCYREGGAGWTRSRTS
jgi:hypothetical protein